MLVDINEYVYKINTLLNQYNLRVKQIVHIN